MGTLSRHVLAQICFFLGHFFSEELDKLSEDFPRAPDWVFDVVCRGYAQCMWWSSALDREQRLWIHRRDGETDESFGQRCRERFPELQIDG